MNECIRFLRRFVHRVEGATMVEYALLVALIALVVIGAVSLLGTTASTTLSSAGSGVAS
jgi:pilus assembly protein Flp/PilA